MDQTIEAFQRFQMEKQWQLIQKILTSTWYPVEVSLEKKQNEVDERTFTMYCLQEWIKILQDYINNNIDINEHHIQDMNYFIRLEHECYENAERVKQGLPDSCGETYRDNKFQSGVYYMLAELYSEFVDPTVYEALETDRMNLLEMQGALKWASERVQDEINNLQPSSHAIEMIKSLWNME